MGNCSDVLHAANNHQVVTAGEGGNVITKILRNSVDKPRMTKTTWVLALVVPQSLACAKDVSTSGVQACVAPSPKVQANWQQRAVSCEALRRRVQDIDGVAGREA